MTFGLHRTKFVYVDVTTYVHGQETLRILILEKNILFFLFGYII